MTLRVISLEPVEWRRGVLAASFEELAGASIQLTQVSGVGDFLLALEKGADVCLLPVVLPHPQDLPNRDGELLTWYLQRTSPELIVCLFYEQTSSKSQELPKWAKAIALSLHPYPEEGEGYTFWVSDFCRDHELSTEPSSFDESWWTSRKWLLMSDDGALEASQNIEDEELATDLSSFLQLKGGQLAASLGETNWSNLTMESEKSTIEARVLETGHSVFSLIDDREPLSTQLPTEVAQILRDLELLTP